MSTSSTTLTCRVSGALTPHQYRVLKHIGEGHSRKDASVILGISDKTVDAHVENIKVKFGIPGDTGSIVRLALRLGIISVSVDPAFANVLVQPTDELKYAELQRVLVSAKFGSNVTVTTNFHSPGSLNAVRISS